MVSGSAETASNDAVFLSRDRLVRESFIDVPPSPQSQFEPTRGDSHSASKCFGQSTGPPVLCPNCAKQSHNCLFVAVPTLWASCPGAPCQHSRRTTNIRLRYLA